jgi:hypothetical protein
MANILKSESGRKKKGVLTLREACRASHVQVGTPLSGLTGFTRRWVMPVSDHRWSCMVMSKDRANVSTPRIHGIGIILLFN